MKCYIFVDENKMVLEKKGSFGNLVGSMRGHARVVNMCYQENGINRNVSIDCKKN